LALDVDMLGMNTATPTRPYTFEKAREAVITLKTLKPALSPAELETLELLMDSEAVETIEQSVKEATAGQFEPLEQVRLN
jgi:hypothetical protein